ncbi:hypothetical protein [Paramicrobacterium humi]|uniref:hypothetical protein n=1 Tax=Paramicrobacterium humi TaxID=640635 RepID=UPI00115F95C0|nr:hypothetical protein [Microbacterium humi]
MTCRGSARMPWDALPRSLVHAVEEALGSPITGAVSQPGGSSPGSADRVVTATGRRAFVKTASRTRDPGAHALHLRRRRVVRRAHLPARHAAPARPW